MDTIQILIVVGVILVVVLALWGFVASRRTRKLRRRFGTEYDLALREYGNRSRAERALEHRTVRAEAYTIRPLNIDEQHRFSELWRHTQARFVDDPPLAIREADHLVCEVMRMRGYPMADFEHRAEDLSVKHPRLVRNYRIAHQYAGLEREGRASTEDLRRAMVTYRDLFDELLEVVPSGTTLEATGR